MLTPAPTAEGCGGLASVAGEQASLGGEVWLTEKSMQGLHQRRCLDLGVPVHSFVYRDKWNQPVTPFLKHKNIKYKNPTGETQQRWKRHQFHKGEEENQVTREREEINTHEHTHTEREDGEWKIAG